MRTAARRLLLRCMVAALLLSPACTATGSDRETRGPARGGILRVAALNDSDQSFDPQKSINTLAYELFRCCLLRTLMSTSGLPTERGGSVIRPDLAAGMPTVSTDGLTWTFHLRAGLHYAPPLEHTEITAPDIIRALEREGDLLASSGLTSSGYYNVIAGFEDFGEGKAQTITGLRAPDPYTLVV